MSDAEEKFIYSTTGTGTAAETTNTQLLIPETSQERYEAAYDSFIGWRRAKKLVSFSEIVLLAYFSELHQKYLPSTIWSKYSMLRSMIKIRNDIDISQYSKLLSFIKQISKGFKSKKAKLLTSNQIQEFLDKAPNNQYLAHKVITIFGIAGACRTREMVNVQATDIENHGNMYLVKIAETQTTIERSFIIAGKFYDIVRKYESLRPPKTLSTRFFLNYRNNKCTTQVVGKNTFSQTPKKIAEFLNLPDPDRYTGHCFRRRSTTLLADTRADTLQTKRRGGWISSSVAEDYVVNSVSHKKATGDSTTSMIKLDISENPALDFVPDQNTDENAALATQNNCTKTAAFPQINPCESNLAAGTSDTVENAQNESSSVLPSSPVGTVTTNTNESIHIHEINLSEKNIVFEESFTKNNTCTFNFTNCTVTINTVNRKID